MHLLDAKELNVGTRVITVSGDRTGTVRALDVASNICAILFDGDKTATHGCNPSEFKILKNPSLRLTGMPPQKTVPRGSL
ncbi:MAG: hypothetical protein EXS51_03365 [Candidatus Taylorbacteria bacterium]|nr:hypothetical protein [Candidatus Taylorbacteria bacterium]